MTRLVANWKTMRVPRWGRLVILKREEHDRSPGEEIRVLCNRSV